MDQEERAVVEGNEPHTLKEIGEAMGFAVQAAETLFWLDRDEVVNSFLVMDTASLGSALREDAHLSSTVVLPGGRAALVAFKAGRDPRLKAWLASGAGVIKFRHVRRLREDTTLTPENLPDRLAIDPPEHQDPQLPLL